MNSVYGIFCDLMRVKDVGTIYRLEKVWIFLLSVYFGNVELFAFYLKYDHYRIPHKSHFTSSQFNETADIKNMFIQLIGRISNI